MKTYYTEKHARTYNRTWHIFSERTLAATCSAIDLTFLQKHTNRRMQILDAACGTGLLLQRLTHMLPDADFYGIDASHKMLEQAHALLQQQPRVTLVEATLDAGTTAGLPYSVYKFDLITCTNTFHYLTKPVDTLRGLKCLLAPGGQLVIEDYARRGFPWPVFEWCIRRIDPQHVQAYTVEEAQNLCKEAGLQITITKTFSVDWLWHGWVLRLRED